jgi:signal transduction histidine kinase
MTEQKITRDDIEAKLRELKDDVDETAESAKSYVAAVAAGVVVLVFVVAFAAGKKRGRRKSTVVEIRRI